MEKIYRIAILLADRDLPLLYHNQQTLPILFSKFFSRNQCELTFFNILEHEYPTNPKDFDVCIITGSKHSVLKREPWAENLYQFILNKKYRKLIGVCYGHQMIALALGGKVERIGWHVGVSTVNYINKNRQDFQARFNHEDQVVTLPDNATLLATSPYCKNTLFQIGNNILSMQFHPEFTQPYHNKLYSERNIYKLDIAALQYAKKTIDLVDDKKKLQALFHDFWQ
tara:strand:- start:181552 stop:182229 length:678 start_codon:yes stop_codon:yes gene_type:complete